MTLEEQLAEAKSAYHALVTGTMARVIVDKNGERVEFTAANRQGLQTYIAELSKSLGLLTPELMPANGPIQFFF